MNVSAVNPMPSIKRTSLIVRDTPHAAKGRGRWVAAPGRLSGQGKSPQPVSLGSARTKMILVREGDWNLHAIIQLLSSLGWF